MPNTSTREREGERVLFSQIFNAVARYMVSQERCRSVVWEWEVGSVANFVHLW